MSDYRATVDAIAVERVPDEDADASYLEQEGWESRLAAYQGGAFGFIGIRARARIRVYLPSHPAGHANLVTVYTPGIWGVEDDSAPDYLAELEAEQRVELVEQLRALRTLEIPEGAT